MSMNIAVFASGKGTNFQAIIDAVRTGEIKANLTLLICDRPDAYAIARAKKAGIRHILVEPKNFKSAEDFDCEIVKYLEEEKIDLIVLAGFMRILSGGFIKKYPNKILNIHPALLPSFKGAEGIKDALNYGVKITGVTVHFVDEQLDHGPVILQKEVKVEENDTEESLAEKIHKEEHKLYPKAIKLLIEDKIKIENRKVKILIPPSLNI